MTIETLLWLSLGLCLIFKENLHLCLVYKLDIENSNMNLQRLLPLIFFIETIQTRFTYIIINHNYT